jgi:hypothetical protein
MIRVVIEVWNEGVSRNVFVQARSPREAASVAAAAYPNASVRVKFPIEPEAVCVKNLATRAEIAGFERLEETAA